MKILAIEKENEGIDQNEFKSFAEEEAATVWKLYKSDKIREIYFRKDENCAVIVLECDLDATEQMVELLHKRLDELSIEGFEDSDFKVQARFSAAEWHKGDDVGLLMLRAREGLEEGEKQSA